MSMTKGELVSRCIKLVYENDNQIDESIVSNNNDYKETTINIPESIERALTQVALAEKLPKKSFSVNAYDDVSTKNYLDIKLSDNVNDLYKIESIRYFDDTYGVVLYNIPFDFKGDDTILLQRKERGEYLITYNPFNTIKVAELADTDVINLPNYILDIVPYFVKGDIYEDTNPQMSLMAVNKFHQYLNQIYSKQNNQTKVEKTYRW